MSPKRRKPGWLTPKEMASGLGITVQAFSRWGVAPVAKIGRETLYDVASVVAYREERVASEKDKAIERLQARIADLEASGTTVVDEARREQMLLVREQREGQSLKNAQLRKELAPVSAIEWVLGRVGAQISAILDSIPLKMKKVLPRLTAAEIEMMKRELVKAQNAAARVTVNLDEYFDRGTDADRGSGQSGPEVARAA